MINIKGVANNPEERYKKYRETLRQKYLYRIGEQYENLTIVDIVKSEKKTLCRCHCKCGKFKNVEYYNLKSGKVRSCGCLRKETISKYASENNHNNNYGYQWYFIQNDEKINCDSSYEAIYANFLLSNNINFEYHNKIFKLDNGIRYTPDFYLIDTDEYIEIKGSYWEKEKIKKINTIKEKININLRFVYWDEIKEIAKIPYCQSSGIIRAAKRAGCSPEDYVAHSKYLQQLK